MAQPTRCDGQVGRRRLSHNNLEENTNGEEGKGRFEEEGCQEAVALRTKFGVLVEHPFFLPTSCCFSRDALCAGKEPAKRDCQHPGRRARRQSAPGRRATGSQSTTTERGDYRWRRKLKAARRRRRRSVNFRRFRHKGDVHAFCASPFFIAYGL